VAPGLLILSEPPMSTNPISDLGTALPASSPPLTGGRVGVRFLRTKLIALEPLVGPAVLLLVWSVANATGLINPRLLPSPLATLRSVGEMITGGDLLPDVGRTLGRTVYAFALAAGFGLPVGILIGASERVYRSLEFLIDFFRSTPATAMFPLFMIIFGLGDFSKIAVAAFSAWLIVVFNVAYGVMNSRQVRMMAARVMGASRLQIFRHVMLFESLPQTFVGMRTAVSLALVVIVVAEMFIGAENGLGKRIIDAQITFDMPQLYGTILVSGALGYGLNLLFLKAQARIVHWTSR
jgi:NitT/TauT family transport system permease protein